MKMKCVLMGLLASTALMGCSTTQDFLNDNQITATQAAQNRGKFEFSCDAVTTTVLNRKTIDLYRIQVPQYQIGVAGCGKKAVYIVNCNAENGCMVYDSQHDFLEQTDTGTKATLNNIE
ncbi:hypothetical protein JCM19232_3884 [Vibrio ishigakensis]|uniref:Lipoprotein n=1 Tax=Vibrio ishigakensis TaxID=1481914 RepID=A0A0B8NTP1_9VIBR|nr:hypothetical protein [Vibrio ishigakensis]GAM54109.1 hypothetical protein JCM19231_3629 [Vibrio ishigakensis]GAM60942.1 hypothetical protein JCM19232_3884 [Vibrio ishigakensis]